MGFVGAAVEQRARGAHGEHRDGERAHVAHVAGQPDALLHDVLVRLEHLVQVDEALAELALLIGEI